MLISVYAKANRPASAKPRRRGKVSEVILVQERTLAGSSVKKALRGDVLMVRNPLDPVPRFVIN